MKKRMKKAGRALIFGYLFFCFHVVPVYANAEVTKPIKNMSSLMIDIISAIGVAVVAWGGFELGNAMQTRDGASKSNALTRIAGGAIMVVISQVVSAITG